jgi:type I restriction enzyme S subunit
LYYLVTNKDFTDYLVANEQGATYPSVNPDIFLKAKVKLPLLPIQKKIASILSAYDDLIENNLKQIRLLEEMAQITYQEWFVRLKFPNHENTPIDETTGLPIGWHFGKVIDLIELQRGFDLPIQDREHGSIPIIASTGTVGLHSSYKVQGAGVVTGRSGTIGQVMFVDSDFFPLNTTLWVKSYKSCKPIFVKHFLDSLNLESLCGGAAVPSLDRKAVHVQKAVIPPAKLMNDFDVYAASHYEAMKVLRSQNQLLKEARDILLPRLITGKITIE